MAVWSERARPTPLGGGCVRVGGGSAAAVLCRHTLNQRRGLPEGNRYCARKWSCSPRPWIE